MDAAQAVQSISFRLADSVPAALLAQWRQQLQLSASDAPDGNGRRLRRLIAAYEDRGHGTCHLRHPAIAKLVQNNLQHFDGTRYRLIEWCVMPNHVHVLIEQHEGVALDRVVNSWKSYTAKRANALLGRRGQFWTADYFDRYVRSESHFEQTARYIRNNPVAAGLCRRAEDWPWSSAGAEGWAGVS